MNKTTNSFVGAVRWRRPLWVVVPLVIGIILVLVIAVVAVLFVFNVWRSFPGGG